MTYNWILGAILALYSPAVLVFQAWRLRRYAIRATLPTTVRDAMAQFHSGDSPLPLWLSAALNPYSGGQTILGGDIVLPADFTGILPFLPGILAHEWAHRVLRHNTLMIPCGAVAGASLIATVTLNHITFPHFAAWILSAGALLFIPLLPILLGRYCEIAADLWVARHAPAEAALLIDYFAQQPDKPRNWATRLFDPHPAPSQRRRAIAKALHRSTVP